MRAGPLSVSWVAGIVLLGTAATLAAQTPAVVRPLQRPVALPIAMTAGTGAYATSYLPNVRVGTTAVPLGNATSVTFTDPSAGTGQSGMAVQHTGGTVQVQFAPNDQLASNAAFQRCASTGCVMAKFTIQTTVQGNTMTWVMENVAVTQFQLSSNVTAMMRYEKLMLTTQQVNSANAGATTPARATYNLQPSPSQ
jgi:hypothetical protein